MSFVPARNLTASQQRKSAKIGTRRANNNSGPSIASGITSSAVTDLSASAPIVVTHDGEKKENTSKMNESIDAEELPEGRSEQVEEEGKEGEEKATSDTVKGEEPDASQGGSSEGDDKEDAPELEDCSLKVMLSHTPVEFSSKKITIDYKIGKTLGKGAFSVVVSATHIVSNKIVAIKCVHKNLLGGNTSQVFREVENLKRVQHPNIIQLYDCREDVHHYYLIMELIKGKELFDKVIEKGYYTEHEAKNAMRQVVTAIKYLHDNQIAHRDLKPENLLCEGDGDNEIVKVADFGLSKDYSRDVLRSRVGSPGYVAPEVLLGLQYEKEVDIWSLGVILYILLVGFPPFAGPSQLNLIVNAEYTFDYPEWDNISTAGKDLIRKLLVKEPEGRLTAKEILEDPWLVGENKNVSTKKLQLLKLKNYQSIRKLKKDILVAGALPSAAGKKKTSLLDELLEAGQSYVP